jgi:hypothetical protein
LRGGHEPLQLTDVVIYADLVPKPMLGRSPVNIQLPDVPYFFGILRHLEFREDVAGRLETIEEVEDLPGLRKYGSCGFEVIVDEQAVLGSVVVLGDERFTARLKSLLDFVTEQRVKD